MTNEDLERAFTFFVPSAIDAGHSCDDFTTAAERAFIVGHLARTGGNQSRAATNMRMHRNTLTRKMKLLKIPRTPNGRRFAKREEAQKASAA